VLTPGVIHLTSVPEHRKVNRVDMGTADKVCVAALAIAAQVERSSRPLDKVSLVLLELGGAFTAAIAVAGGKIVDGAGGSAGPLGFRAAGALDGEVAYLAGAVPKAMLLQGFARVAKEGAQGAALVADGLAGGRHRQLVETMAIRAARGTVLDHLYVVPRDAARRRLGLG